eukprot:Gb_34610 [translate_table: standard]
MTRSIAPRQSVARPSVFLINTLMVRGFEAFFKPFQHNNSIPAAEKVLLPSFRCITTTSFKSTEATAIRSSWIDKIKGVFTGTKTQTTEESQPAAASFTLENYADELKKARKVGSLAQFVRGRSGEVTITEAFEKQEAIIRALASYDSSGEVKMHGDDKNMGIESQLHTLPPPPCRVVKLRLESKHKADAAKHCSCTIADVENALAKFTWAKAAQKKIDKLKEEGKAMPKSLAEFVVGIEAYIICACDDSFGVELTCWQVPSAMDQTYHVLAPMKQISVTTSPYPAMQSTLPFCLLDVRFPYLDRGMDDVSWVLVTCGKVAISCRIASIIEWLHGGTQWYRKCTSPSKVLALVLTKPSPVHVQFKAKKMKRKLRVMKPSASIPKSNIQME